MHSFCRSSIRSVALTLPLVLNVDSAALGQTRPASVRIRVKSNVAYSPANQIKRFFADGGMNVIESDGPDVAVEVQFNGRAVSAEYSNSGVGKGTAYNAGAIVDGTFRVEARNRPAVTRTFSGQFSPPSAVPLSGLGTAPFEKAFLTSTFFSQLADCLTGAFDSSAMTTFWLSVIWKSAVHPKLARDRLAALGPAVITPVLDSLRAGLIDDANASAILSELRDGNVFVPLLTDTDPRIRRLAATVLSRKHEERFNPPLAQILAAGKDASVRSIAASGLFGDGAMEALARAAKDDTDAIVRRSALLSLSSIGNAPIHPVILALNDPHPVVRTAALDILGRSTSKTAVGPLIAAMQGQPASNIRTIVDTLKKITGQDFGTDQKAWAKWWETQPKN